MDIREDAADKGSGSGSGNIQGISTGVLFACIAGTLILVVVLGCLGHRRHKKRLIEKHVEHGS